MNPYITSATIIIYPRNIKERHTLKCLKPSLLVGGIISNLYLVRLFPEVSP